MRPGAAIKGDVNVVTLLADPRAVSLDFIRPSLSAFTLVRVHSRYCRRVADLPWHGVAVKLELHTRRFRCLNGLCTKRIFCERLPRVVTHYARKTVRLNAALELIGFALGGAAGARLALALCPAGHMDVAAAGEAE